MRITTDDGSTFHSDSLKFVGQDIGLGLDVNENSEAELTLYGNYTANGKTYGAVGDGVTDDSAAIQAAIDAVAVETATAGGVMFLPKGVYITNSTIIVKNKVRVIGEGSRATIVRAGPTFPNNSPVFQLGDTSTVFDATIEHLQVDANGKTGSKCLYSNKSHEQSGIYNCVLQSFTDKGAHFASGSSLCEIRSSEFNGDDGHTASIHIDSPSGPIYMAFCTINSDGTADDGVLVSGGSMWIWGLHVESCTDAIHFTGGTGSISVLHGHSTTPNLIHIGSSFNGAVSVIHIDPNGSTNLVVDDARSETIAAVGKLLGAWMLSNDGPGAATKTRFHTETDSLSYWNGLHQFAGGVATLTKAGVPADGDFPITPPNGTLAVDTSNSNLYVRIGGSWVSVAVS